MFDADKKRWDAAQQEMQAQIAALSKQITEVGRKAPEPPAQPGVTDKDVDAFGGDLIDLMRRVATDATAEAERRVQAALAAKDEEISQLRQQVGGVTEKTVAMTRETYFKALAGQVPEWETVNAEQGFLDWLAESDPLTGLQRQTYLDDAVDKLDVKRTVALFRAYKPQVQPPASPQPQPRQQPSPQQELNRQVQPSTSQAMPPVTPSNTPNRVWSNAEIDQFYGDVTKGVYRGREGDMARINADIDLAISEGRVRP